MTYFETFPASPVPSLHINCITTKDYATPALLSPSIQPGVLGMSGRQAHAQI